MSQNQFIPLCVPHLKGNELKYVTECVETEWVSSAGKYVNLFEEKIAELTGAKHAIAVVNGTAALHISLLLAGVQPGDEVICPTATFIAPINAVRYLFADPIFMDCDQYYNIDVLKVRDFIANNTTFNNGFTYNAKTGRRIAAIIPVHIFGNAVQMEDLVDLCAERNIRIVEDATESLGTRYTSGRFKGKSAGSIGEFGCLSFNGNKIITTGGGGMILTDDSKLAQKARYLTTQSKDDEIRYIHNEVGFNYRLTNLQAAIGVAQVESFASILKTKKENYLAFKEQIGLIPGLSIADQPSFADNNCWMYAMQIDVAKFGADREQVMKYLADNKVQSRPLWYLNHLQKPFKSFETFKITKALEMLETTLNIPCSANLTASEVTRVVQVLKSLRNGK